MKRNLLFSGLLLFGALWTAGCSRTKSVDVGEISDPPESEEAAYRDLPDYAPGYGIVLSGAGNEIEVSIEAEDSPKVRAGQTAVAYDLPASTPVRCRVSRVLRSVSAETGESLAWLEPAESSSLRTGEFVYAMITTDIRKHVLSIPEKAVLIRDGHLFVVREDT